nr:PKD domain-containing protein [Desulfobulbaceae bacterium]
MKAPELEKHPHIYQSTSFLKSLLLLFSVILTSCNGGGGGGGDGSSISSATGNIAGVAGVALGGNVSDGPITGGAISIYDVYDQFCNSSDTNDDATYSLTIENTCKPPYKIELTGGVDLITDLSNATTMYSLSLSSGQINASPLTTIIYHAALARSGADLAMVRSEDIELITGWVISKFNFGIDAANPESGGFNPLTTSIDDTNSIIFVKANEGLIETTRRVTLLMWNGEVTDQTIGAVLASLGEDISDGQLDGRNFNGTTSAEMSRIATLWELTTATVSMEMMLNQMSVTLTDNQIIERQELGLQYLEMLDYDFVNARFAIAISAISNHTVDTAASGLLNIQPTRQFINQAKAAAMAALVLAYQANVDLSYYVSFINALNSMKAALEANGNTTTPVTGLDAPNLLSNMSDVAASITPPVDSNIEVYNEALFESATTMTVSTPIVENRRQVLVKWSYPTSSTSHDGFKIFQEGVVEPLCIINNPEVRSSEGFDCFISNANPGEEITIYMSAYSNTLNAESKRYSNTMPLAHFSTQYAVTATCPLDVQFEANEGALREYTWSFGDGVNYDGFNTVDHIYDAAGTYSINLSVTDTDIEGIFSISNQASIDVTCW